MLAALLKQQEERVFHRQAMDFEDDTCVAVRALPKHPSQRDLGEFMPLFVLYGASTDICVSANEPHLDHSCL